VSHQLEGDKRGRTRSSLIAAYEAYQREEPGSMDILLQSVRKFATSKLIHLEHDFAEFGTAENTDDWAQEVTIKVWRGMDTTRTPSSFYAWVHKIAFNQASASFNNLVEEQDVHASLTKPIRDKNGEDIGDVGVKDNPELYTGGPSSRLYIPQSVQGIDLNICKLILAGMTYAEIGEDLQMTEDAIWSRVKRLKKRIAAERATEKKANEARWKR
jgi:DNA-directed RNA polymerase specialized sigma24 family protein